MMPMEAVTFACALHREGRQDSQHAPRKRGSVRDLQPVAESTNRAADARQVSSGCSGPRRSATGAAARRGLVDERIAEQLEPSRPSTSKTGSPSRAPREDRWLARSASSTRWAPGARRARGKGCAHRLGRAVDAAPCRGSPERAPARTSEPVTVARHARPELVSERGTRSRKRRNSAPSPAPRPGMTRAACARHQWRCAEQVLARRKGSLAPGGVGRTDVRARSVEPSRKAAALGQRRGRAIGAPLIADVLATPR